MTAVDLGGSEADRLANRLHWTLRLACAACFVGHGAFGFIAKVAWLPYFGVAGIEPRTAYPLMPFVGAHDVFLAAVVLLWPCRAAVTYMVFWCIWTAALRPLTGEPVWETLERAGNYGLPLAFLLSLRPQGWFSPAQPAALEPGLIRRLELVLRVTTSTLLLGHGALEITHVPGFVRHWTVFGLGPLSALTPMDLALAAGLLEIAVGFAVLAAPWRSLMLFVLAWKMATELLYPLSGTPFWEFVERAGSYAAPLGLFLLLGWRQRQRVRATSPQPAAA